AILFWDRRYSAANYRLIHKREIFSISGSSPQARMRQGKTDMSEAGGVEVTHLLHRWTLGDRSALESLMPLVYAELRRVARRSIAAERPDHTLQTTALVHEAYLKLVRQDRAEWK